MNRIALFINILSFLYISAFSSLLIQSKGLYGDQGILPIKLLSIDKNLLINKIFRTTNTFINFSIINIAGIILSSFTFLFDSFKSKLSFAVLWMLYFIVYQAGQTFLGFQWDILLLEIGVIGALLPSAWVIGQSRSVSNPKNRNNAGSKNEEDVEDDEQRAGSLVFWLLKWLLFRLMFSSGVVKLQSNCPTWWSLTALDWHYESQCIPTLAAWYSHKLPSWFQRLSVVGTYFIEIAMPIFFFVPVRTMQLFAFSVQVLLQLLIIMTGNYNFFNLLTLALCLSLLPRNSRQYKSKTLKALRRKWEGLEHLFSLGLIFWLVYQTAVLFGVRYNVGRKIVTSKTSFSKAEFESFMRWSVPITVYVGIGSLLVEILRLLFRTVAIKGLLNKISYICGLVLATIVTIVIFSISLVPYTASLDRNFAQRLPNNIVSLHQQLDSFQIVSSYGLFRRMTGVGGRPEVIIQASDSFYGPFHEYEFKYKPGDLGRAPPFIIPHQPRLDWQMWFAALGTYEHNPWFVNLVYRLLQNESSVIDLLDKAPLGRKPPKFVQAGLYHYHFTTFQEFSKTGSYWKRSFKHEFLPPMSLEHEGLLKYVKENKLDQSTGGDSHSWYHSLIQDLIDRLDQSQGHWFVWTILGCCSLLKLLIGHFF